MNGRCETDPFDRAVDVCRMCFGEFCLTCLVETRPKEQPMCRDCALIVGGLRPKTKPKIRGDKKTAKARRAALQEARDQPMSSTSFTYFDAGEPLDEAPEPEAEPATKGRRKDDEEPAPDQEQANRTGQDPGSQEVADTPAIRRLTSIRQADRTPAGAATAAAPGPTAATDGSMVGPPQMAPLDTTIDEDDPMEAEFRKPRRYIDQQARPPANRKPADKQQDAGKPDGGKPDAGTATPGMAGDSRPTAAMTAPSATAPAVTEEEPVHIDDDPWARTGPEAVSTPSPPRRQPDPKPSENGSDTAPDWTKAKLPRRR